MGLGKTAQLIAALLADPVEGPTLVVCPVSVLGNWERELARFAPSLEVLDVTVADPVPDGGPARRRPPDDDRWGGDGDGET